MVVSAKKINIILSRAQKNMKQARNNWLITDAYCGSAVADKFSDLDKVFSCTGEKITRDLISQVIKTSVGDKYFYVKRYTAAGKAFRRYFGRSRIRAEWENLIAFARLGVPTPNLVGFGQRLHFGQFKCGALITEEIVDSIDLAALAKTQPNRLQNKQWRLSVIYQVADYTRLMHEGGYVHGNLNWRNLLVTLNGDPQIYFIDCPAGGLKRGPALICEQLNDLAFLDKLGRLYLSSSDQLRFYKRYHKITKLTDSYKQNITVITQSLDKHRLRQQLKKTKLAGANHG